MWQPSVASSATQMKDGNYNRHQKLLKACDLIVSEYEILLLITSSLSFYAISSILAILFTHDCISYSLSK